MPERPLSSSLSSAAMCGAVAPGPLHGLLAVLAAMDGDPLRCLALDAADLGEAVNDAIELLNHACSDGDGNGGGYEPTLWDRRRAIIEAAARLAEAKADLAAVRRALDVLVPVVGAAAALVEVQTRLAEPPS